MAYETLAKIKYILTLSICPISMCLNILLFCLIKYRSPKAMFAYKKVLYLGCIADFFNSLWFLLGEPQVATIQGVVFVFTEGILGYLPFPWSAWTYPITIFFVYFCLVNALIQFVYRYLLVCWGVQLKKWMFGGLVLFGAGVVLMYVGNFIGHLFSRRLSDQNFAPLLIGTEFEKVAAFGAFPLIDFPNVLYIVLAIVISSYTIVIYCGISVWRQLKKNAKEMSEKTKKYQKQISVVMTIEALVPIVTVVFPVALNFTMIFTLQYFEWEGKTTVILISLAPFVNPIVKLTVISAFRKGILRQLKLDHLWNSSINNHNNNNISINPIT